VSQKARTTFVLVHPTEILAALVGLKDVVVLHYERRGLDVELMIEQVTGMVLCRVIGSERGALIRSGARSFLWLLPAKSALEG
jgi:transposase